MKYHALLVIFEKAAKFEIVVCCKLQVALYGLTYNTYLEREIFTKSKVAVIFGCIDNLYNKPVLILWVLQGPADCK